MSDPFPKVTIKNIDAALRFLPLFEGEKVSFGQWHPGTVVQEQPKVIESGWASWSETVEAFVTTLYDNGFIIDFDWMDWGDEAREYERPEVLATADLETIRKLLTGHVRADRFCEGHLLSVLESGLITAILRRLRTIRESAG